MAYKQRPFDSGNGGGKRKNKGKKGKVDEVDFNLYQGASGASMDREIAKREWVAKASKEEQFLGSKLLSDGKGGFIVQTRTTSSAY
jgi:hypothetical protein